MKSVKVLDCTLRDGGCVIDFDFGDNYMNMIKSGLEEACIDIVECGYLDEFNGSNSGRTKFNSVESITEKLLNNKDEKITYLAMMDYGKFDVKKVPEKSKYTIDGIRIAFHKRDRFNALKDAQKLLSKGYQVYIQPMLTLRYSDEELIEFINRCNVDIPNMTAFYIVDSFGQMRSGDIVRLGHLIDHNLAENISIGFHSHNNLQLSYSNSVTLLDFSNHRDLIFDSCIMGMGKGAGNLNTELFCDHMNMKYSGEYLINPLLEVIDSCLNNIYKDNFWGYSIAYYLSALNGCSPSYAKYYYNKHMLSIDVISELLASVTDEKKISFDSQYAEQLYINFNEKYYDDKDNIQKLNSILKHKNVLLIGPGKSLTESHENIQSMLEVDDTISIWVNNWDEKFKTDYTFISSSNRYKHLMEKYKKINNGLIITSNLLTEDESKNVRSDDLILDYKNWIVKEQDYALFILLNVLSHINVKTVYLAGFDGYTTDMESNYYNEALYKPLNKNQTKKKNAMTIDFLKNISGQINIKFLTESLYEKGLRGKVSEEESSCICTYEIK